MNSLRLWLTAVCFATTVAFAAAQAPAPAPDTLRVMTFNIRNSGAKDGPNGWQFRTEKVAATIRDFDPDLLGTQEVLADQFDELGRMFPEYTRVGVARDDGARSGEWSAILYRTTRFEAVDSGTFWLSEAPNTVGSASWKAACVRICTWARLRDRHSGRVLLHANTHFDHESALAREESAKLLRRQLPTLAQGVPVVLTGDFNCTEDDGPYRTLTASTTPGLALLDSYRITHPERLPDEASFNGFKGTITGARIDWILHTRDFEPIASSIVRPAAATPPVPSDHYPVTAVLRLKPDK
ncbi:MAG TPA: endonuclease/exonuclease/phosphatase family protein [Chthoniobacteraceae bacterium]|nr:endonuclease [Chthoniobacter sp.]HEV7868149.1 endonuclease/exonuclease/phosphatase family protein [Chthoniobacteraceae bacterium]